MTEIPTTHTKETQPTENIFGIAKRMSLELEKLTLVDHGAIIGLINAAAQRREMNEKLERQQAQLAQAQRQQEANQQAYADAMAAHQKRAAEQAAKDAGIVLVNG